MTLENYKRPEDGLDPGERKSETVRLTARLAVQQQRIREAKLPVVVLVEGWAASGKGSLINQLISEMDPRFFTVVSPKPLPEGEERFPFLQKYFAALPEEGKFLFLDAGWMEETVTRHLRRELTGGEYERRVESCNIFERQLRDNGYVVIKLFIHISREEQLRRMTLLREDRDTEWRVTDRDLWQQRQYDRFRRGWGEFMTDTAEYAPWHVLDGEGRKRRLYDALRIITDTVDRALKAGRLHGEPLERRSPLLEMPRLEDVDLGVSVTDEEYKKELKRLQGRLTELHNRVYRKRIPVVLCYEGWDAGGKGGNIRRLTYALDPRGFDVHPIAGPEPHELSRHYLWRFWTRLPRSGHVAIFDRSWYGRVLVERVEGLCEERDWQRACTEINEFERELTDWGAVVLKFWIHIDPDTQLRRFKERENTPEKQWKITDEDWRNRDKWPLYQQAAQEMLDKTSTETAPWHIIESVDKKYARLRTLRIVTEALERAVDGHIVGGMESACLKQETLESGL